MKTKFVIIASFLSFLYGNPTFAKFIVHSVNKKVALCNTLDVAIKVKQELISIGEHTLKLSFSEASAFVKVFDTRIEKNKEYGIWKIKPKSETSVNTCITIKIMIIGNAQQITVFPNNSVSVIFEGYQGQKFVGNGENEINSLHTGGQNKEEQKEDQLPWDLVLLDKKLNDSKPPSAVLGN